MQCTGRLTFAAEWYQEQAALIRPYILCYYVEDKAVELYKKHTGRLFLRRTKIDDLSYADLFLGAKVLLFGRTFDIVGYVDTYTKQFFTKFREKTFLLIKYSLWSKQLGTVLTALVDCGFSINNAVSAQFTPKLVDQFLNEKTVSKVQISVLMNELLLGPAIGIEIIGENAFSIVKNCLAQRIDTDIHGLPNAFYKLCEQEEIRKAIYCSLTEEDVLTNMKFFFNPRNNLQVNCIYNNSTLVIIKPHAIKEGNIGRIITEINKNGFRISTLRMLIIARRNCEEFYEVFRGILPEYLSLVAQLASGVCMCLEVVCEDETKNTPLEFRNLCGPMDPKMAKLVRPETLHAKYGTDKVKNAIHCTVLPTDTYLELQYFFRILDQSY